MANRQRTMAKWLVWAWLGVSTALVGCGRTPGERMGGETHFLSTCASTCAEGLSCVSGVCTTSCERDAECQALSSLADCREDTGQCDVSCSRNTECIEFGEDYRCSDGVCRLPRKATGALPNTDEPPSASGGAPNAAGGTANVDSPDPSSGGSSTMGGGSSDGGTDLPPMAILPCPDDIVFEGDPLMVNSALIDGDELNLEVSHGGGCGEHTYVACFQQAFDTSLPVQTGIQLMHDANGDTCEALLTKKLSFDLTPLADHYNDTFDAQGGVIATNYGLYHFGELSCDETRAAAAYSLDERLEDTVETQCETVEDCVQATLETGCFYSCGPVITSSILEVESAIAAVNAEFCVDFESECGPIPIPGCVPPGELACIDGVCTGSEP